jgi:pimeloyl-ACP methyl ester carboxylesterase
LADEAAVINYINAGWCITAGSKHPFDEMSIRALAAEEVRRSNNLPSMRNHALLTVGDRYYDRLGEINVPALVIHSTEDPINHYQHGVTLAKAIPGATLLTLEGTGHELHQNH